MVLPDGAHAGETVKTTLLPFTLAGERPGVTRDPPRFSADADALLAGIGYDAAEIDALRRQGAVA